jgi:hypothetical protein
MKRLAISIAVVASACDAPPLTLVYTISNGPGGQTCGEEVRSCADMKLECASVLSVRIISPEVPNEPHVSVCKDIPINGNRDLCSIAQINLPPTDLPKDTLEVQVLVWPRSSVTDPVTGELDCLRNEVSFESGAGFPISMSGEPPAFGGRTYFHPGDRETLVTLGCTYPESVVGATCGGSDVVAVSATVNDFETGVSVSAETGDTLSLLVDEPERQGDGHVFNPNTASPLPRGTLPGPPSWGDLAVPIDLKKSACVEVIEDVPQTVATLACTNQNFPGPSDIDKPPPRSINLTGVLLSKASLQQILNALQLPAFPDEGLTIGITLESVLPRSGVTVTATPSVDDPTPIPNAVQYLSADRMSVGGTATTSSGIWVATGVPYGTIFEARSGGATSTGIGGLVKGKVTVVVLQLGTVVGP